MKIFGALCQSGPGMAASSLLASLCAESIPSPLVQVCHKSTLIRIRVGNLPEDRAIQCADLVSKQLVPSPWCRHQLSRSARGSCCREVSQHGMVQQQPSVRTLGTDAAERNVSAQSSAFAEPSVTAADVQKYAKEVSGRSQVLTYLKAEGVNTRELKEVELPTTLEVIQDRIRFLRKICLTTDDINNYPLMIGCSVKKNVVPVLDYLENIGITREALPHLIRKYPQVLHSSVVIDLQPVVGYLRGLGIDNKDIGKVLIRYPDILGFRIEGTMSTSVAYLVSLGVNIREIGGMLTEYPEILGMRVGNNIKPKVDYLAGLGIPRGVIAAILETRPFLLGFDLEESMKPAVEALVTIGVTKEALGEVVVRYPDLLGLEVMNKYAPKINWLIKVAGLTQDDGPKIVEKLPQILVINIELAGARITTLKDAGFNVPDVRKMIVQCPVLLAVSVENVLKPHLDFFVKKMKRPLKELVDFPEFFTYGLEERIKPRYQRISDKKVNCSLSWFLNCGDQKFDDRLSVDYVKPPTVDDSEPEFKMGGRLQLTFPDESDGFNDDEEEDEMRKLYVASGT
eukprot:TRINITY_DN3564_c0_g1_i1.p1 TRINITY_DN3564_c0_g1~~TRINITY_DN3564_c0_g1_i1.p1  ORF type:complete len:568 (-),score=92.03 TRINITY_DN3564_c0_g1_i1:9-1712(-)